MASPLPVPGDVFTFPLAAGVLGFCWVVRKLPDEYGKRRAAGATSGGS